MAMVRRPRWGDDEPADDAAARERLLLAAEICYERMGITGTSVEDIARQAGVHRTTVYKFFAGRDDILTAVLLRESEGVIARAEETFASTHSFVEAVVPALVRAMNDIASSRYLRLLLTSESAAMTMRVATASQEFRSRVARAITGPAHQAQRDSELRSDVSLDELVDWLVRLTFVLAPEAAASPDHAARMLSLFVLPALVSGAASVSILPR
jgi:AcrR family transcriptional regulator